MDELRTQPQPLAVSAAGTAAAVVAMDVAPNVAEDDLRLHRAACLLTRIRQLEADGAVRTTGGALDDARALLQRRELRWVDVLQAERLVLGALNRETADAELRRRLAERGRLEPEAQAFYDGVALTLDRGTPEERQAIDPRHLLLRLVEDLHAQATVTHRKRRFILRLRERKVRCFITSFALFLAVSAVFIGTAAVLTEQPPPWLGVLAAITDPVVAVFAGLLGASFSMLRTREASLEAIKLAALEQAAGWWTLLARLSVGVGGSLFIYYVLVASDFNVPLLGDTTAGTGFRIGGEGSSVQQHAALAVICFVAGFTEKLAPGVIEMFTRKVGPQPEARA